MIRTIVTSERLERLVGKETLQGWQLATIDGDHAVLRRPNFGSTFGHVVVFVLTVWFTLGLGNVLYALYRYIHNTEYKVVSATDPIDDEDALQTLRRRYARGDLDEDEFERRLEMLLATESIEEVEQAY